MLFSYTSRNPLDHRVVLIASGVVFSLTVRRFRRQNE